MKLIDYLKVSCLGTETLTFDEIYTISGLHVDHRFMNRKKELESYGFSVVRIDLNSRTVRFTRNA